MAAAALFAFIAAAMVGGFMAILHFRGQKSWVGMGIIHGLLVLIGFVSLVMGLVFVSDVGWGWWLVVAFLVTASGGAYLFYRQHKGEPWPGLVIIAHGSAAILSIVLLGLWLFSDPAPPAGTDSQAAPLGPAQLPTDSRTNVP